MQTDADCARVVDGLANADAKAADSAKALESVIKRLAPRWFVLRDAHAGNHTVLFQPRFAISLLRGPMTRQELLAARRSAPADEAPRSRRAIAERPVPHAAP